MAAVITLIVLMLLKGTKVIAQVTLDPAFAASHSCDAQCQYLTNSALAYEASQRVHVNDSIYTVSSKFMPHSKPGSVLAVEAVTNLTGYTVPSGLTVSRFQYTTTNLNGTAIPASAYVLWPYTPYVSEKSKHNSDNSGIPFVAWAHGTTGSGAVCAPSNYHNLQYHFIVPYPLALAGFAVVAPDYAGLGVGHFSNGTRIPHAWLSAPSHANDLANAVIAARTAFPALSENFVAMGHSQGGAAAYDFAERQAKSPVSGYLGTISIAPPTTPIKNIEAAYAHPNDEILQIGFGYQVRVLGAITADYPAYNYSGFTEAGLQKWQIEMEYNACLPGENLLFGTPPTHADAAKRGWYEDKTVQTWVKRVSGGGKPIAGPLLVLAGELDSAVPLAFVKESFGETCRLKENSKQSTELQVYQGLQHFPLIYGSQAWWIDWVKARFDGEVIEKRCASSFKKLPRVAGTKQTVFANYLIALPLKDDEVWKAGL